MVGRLWDEGVGSSGRDITEDVRPGPRVTAVCLPITVSSKGLPARHIQLAMLTGND